jgi:predicted DNA-binding protein (MmcQ/YjbR family)
MIGSALQQTAADCAEELPAAQLEHPFGPAWEVRELVTDSYRLVVAHLPKAEQPVDPHTYGTGTRVAR